MKIVFIKEFITKEPIVFTLLLISIISIIIFSLIASYKNITK